MSKEVKGIVLAIAKDLLKYGYGFNWFKSEYPICIEAGEDNCRIVWEEAKRIMSNK